MLGKGGHQPKATVAQRRVIFEVKRTQRANRPCHRAPKCGMYPGRRRRASRRKAATEARKGRSRGNESGVVEQGMFVQGSPRNLGDLMFPTVRRRKDRPREQAFGREAGSVCRRTGASTWSGHERQRDALWSRWCDGDSSANRWSIRSRSFSIRR